MSVSEGRKGNAIGATGYNDAFVASNPGPQYRNKTVVTRKLHYGNGPAPVPEVSQEKNGLAKKKKRGFPFFRCRKVVLKNMRFLPENLQIFLYESGLPDIEVKDNFSACQRSEGLFVVKKDLHPRPDFPLHERNTGGYSALSHLAEAGI
jgi:hypothetical protein